MTRSLLIILAHPDDEAFMAAGTCRCYTDDGVPIALVTATLGQQGGIGDPPLYSREELPRRREAELRAACEHMGIAELHVLPYEDKRLAEAPVEEMRTTLVRLIRRHRPAVVLTFDPNGTNGHPDHVAISRFAMEAVVCAADPRLSPELGEPHTVARVLWPSLTPVFELGQSSDPAALAGVDFLFDIGTQREAKAAALRAHRTQHQSIDRLFFPDGRGETTLRWEAFRQAWGPPLARRPERDLFVGL